MTEIQVSVVLPCLNEEETIEASIKKGFAGITKTGLPGEVIVVDNGSTDKSVELSKNLGARVINESEKGYGNALRRGIDDAYGKYIIMGDSDDTYDFSELDKFVKLLKDGGYDLVMGSRFKGKILPGAMSWTHRYIGNPILSGILRVFFGGNVSDSHCGLRAFTKDAYKKMGLQTTGMEFASEMVIHALKLKLKIGEIPITYYPRRGESKLMGLRDAWRHTRFMLLYSPNYLFLLPGLLLFIPGIVMLITSLFGPLVLFGREWGIHVMVFASMMTILGWQILSLGLCAKSYALNIGLEESGRTKWLLRVFSIERAAAVSLIMILAGIGLILYILVTWMQHNFGALAEQKTALLAVTLITVGLQTIFSAFLTSMLQIKYRK
ncbi:MAG: glycosyltransferase family 2 protein [Elusimicrobiota bacterium]